jgi:hypothetical protein
MTEQAPPWPKQGPASYFPSIEKRYGRSIAEWQQIIAGCGREKHMDIVDYLKSEYGMGHGHANALVGWTLAGNIASPWIHCAVRRRGPGMRNLRNCRCARIRPESVGVLRA